MYKEAVHEQQDLEDFVLPFGGHLNENNRWVVLSRRIPWSKLEEDYADNFSDDNGAPAKSVREALGSLIIKEKLDISDREVLAQICENPYLQYFLGYECYSDEEPFHHSLMSAFRARCSGELLEKLNDILFQDYQEDLKKNGGRWPRN